VTNKDQKRSRISSDTCHISDKYFYWGCKTVAKQFVILAVFIS